MRRGMVSQVRRGASRVLADQLERLPNGGQHPQRQAVHFENALHVEIVLVPFDHGAVRHRRVLNRNDLAQRPARDDHPADMLTEMAREAEQLLDENHQLLSESRFGIEADFAES